jgi:hypothetical protein
MLRSERLLVALLYLCAAVSSLAAIPVVMPHRWMDISHRWLGMGELPQMPVIVYLTRSLSALYVFHGGMLWFMARDVRRYSTLITYLGFAFVGFGIVTAGIDLCAHLPVMWIAMEGPLLMGVGVAILVLQRYGR